MYPELVATIASFQIGMDLKEERKDILLGLAQSIDRERKAQQSVNLMFICTHNSRRSQFAQIWAQAAVAYYELDNILCYSGGTEETVLFEGVVETLQHQGFFIGVVAQGANPIYSIKYEPNGVPILGFSKRYTSFFHPADQFIAIMTCSQATDACPFVSGAKQSIALAYEDPQVFDGQYEQKAMYSKKSLEIAKEIFYVFAQLKK
ncbi:low molecular weight phosphatase family protein [Myroides odoratus]|uniref:arsenate-mycothiol transferase ArsC n=1 Tax=Myroides odoratus TaxID=256 RepID=UPI0039AF18B5